MPSKKPLIKAPWEPTDDEIAEHDHWADYVAWERWMAHRADGGDMITDMTAEWDAMDGILKSFLYAAMVSVAEHAQEVSHGR